MSINHNLYARLADGFAAASTCIELINGERFTYADLETLSARAANVLMAQGLQAGDRVSVMCEKSADLVWLYLGCLRAGLVYHPLNTGYTAKELGFFFADAGTALVVMTPALRKLSPLLCVAVRRRNQR